MRSLGIGIAGCGNVARKHARAIAQVSGCELVAACDKEREALNEFIEETGVKGYVEYQEMLEDPGVDMVSICTPSGLHCSQIIEAAFAGKHVLVEKPVAVNLGEIDLAVDACRVNGVTLGVVHQNRFNEPVQRLYGVAGEGCFGRVTHASASIRRNRNYAYYQSRPWRKSRSMGGGVLANQAIHNLDLLCWIMGPVEEVFAYTKSFSGFMEGEEVGVAVLKFASGAVGTIESASTIYPGDMGDTLNIFGETGTVILGGKNVDRVIKWEFKNCPAGNPPPPGRSGTHTDVIRDMVDSVHTGRTPAVSGEDARKAVELLLALYKSSDLGVPVKLPLSV